MVISSAPAVQLTFQSSNLSCQYRMTQILRELVVTLKNGSVTRVPLSDIITNLATEAWVESHYRTASDQDDIDAYGIHYDPEAPQEGTVAVTHSEFEAAIDLLNTQKQNKPNETDILPGTVRPVTDDEYLRAQAGAVEGNFAQFDSSGSVVDSGLSKDDFAVIDGDVLGKIIRATQVAPGVLTQ